MTDRPPPRLSTNGCATIYLIIPPGTFADEYRHVTHVLSRAATPHPDQQNNIISETPEVVFLLGQARLAARVQASNYRDVLERAYPDRESKALVSNAVFSIPYVPEAGTTAPAPPGSIRFFTHLRVRRTTYAVDPVAAETLIIEKLRKISKDKLGEESCIEAGLGWADFLVSSIVPPKKFNDFLALLVDFNRVTIDDAVGGPGCVFKRSLTLLGYVWNGVQDPPKVNEKFSALMFIRASPGRLSEVEKLVKEAFPDTDVAFVDGKIDVIASMSKQKRPDFFQQHELLSEQTGVKAIEKFETHVIFGHDLFRDSEEDQAQAKTYGGDCGCSDRVVHPLYDAENLPEPLVNAIKNIEFLFASTMRDPANCCDARTAILACEESLKRLLYAEVTERIEMREELERITRGLGDPAVVLDANTKIVETLQLIDRRVRMSERILRQRTVGAFEEFLGQSDRAVSYRGGAQKVLTVADNLLNDFYEKLVGPKNEAFLTSLYDSVDRIQHVVGTGFVRMPVRALFFLPGMVPDLWHEVGGFHFFKTFLPSHLGLDRKDLKDALLYRDLADSYGDLVSFLYGFRLDVEQFGTALLEGWIASQPYDSVPQDARRASYVHILARIVAISEFLVPHADPEMAEYPRAVLLTVLYDEACQLADRYNSDKLPLPDDSMIDEVLAVLEDERFHGGLEVLRQSLKVDDIEKAVAELDDAPPDEKFKFGEPADLRAFKPGDDLNDEFRNLWWAVMDERRKTRVRPHAFAFTAALTRGAALEYHRRSARRMA